MGWVLMSEREVHRVEVLSSVVARRMSTSEAASVLCLSDRQVQRLLKTFREDGAVALRHKARGRPSNNRSLEGLRDLTLSIVRERYADFGPTLAAEKLAERDGVKVSRETLRPAAVAARAEFGHWECDLMMFRKEFGTANVTSLVERVSRFTLLARNSDRQSKPVMEGLIAGLSPLPQQARRSITFDRGTEFSAWLHLQSGLGTQTWFCDPQAPWQKGTVENTNNRLRAWLPRRADPTALTDAHLKAISARLNTTPRKCLGYRTPDEIFRARLLEIIRADS